MLESLSTPVAIKTSDLHSNIAVQGLLSSDRVLPVPPIVNDIAGALPWLLEMKPLEIVYRSVAVNLLLVCDWQSPSHISPYDAHFRNSLVVANINLRQKFEHQIYGEAMDLVWFHLLQCWGETFAGFRNILSDIVGIIFNNYSVYMLCNALM